MVLKEGHYVRRKYNGGGRDEGLRQGGCAR